MGTTHPIPPSQTHSTIPRVRNRQTDGHTERQTDRQTVTDYLQITFDGRVSGAARAAPRWFVSRVSE